MCQIGCKHVCSSGEPSSSKSAQGYLPDLGLFLLAEVLSSEKPVLTRVGSVLESAKKWAMGGLQPELRIPAQRRF